MGLKELREGLAASFVERDAEIDALLLGLVSQEHVLFISGIPGLAKSAVVRRMAKMIDGGIAVVRVLNKNTSPEEIFGYQDMAALMEQRKWARHSEDTLPLAHVFFADEIWKCSSATGNTLLSSMEEREVVLDGRRIEIPLRMMVGASNEWPGEDHQDSSALFDRFTIRRTVQAVSPSNWQRLRAAGRTLAITSKPGPVCTLNEIDEAAGYAAGLRRTQHYEDAFDQILRLLAAEKIYVGDRRQIKADKVAAANATLRGAAQVEVCDLEPLADVLWTDPMQVEKAAEIVQKIANPVGSKLNEILREVEQIATTAVDKQTARDALPKLEECKERADALAVHGNGRAGKLVQAIDDRIILATAIAMDRSADSVRAFLAATK